MLSVNKICCFSFCPWPDKKAKRYLVEWGIHFCFALLNSRVVLKCYQGSAVVLQLYWMKRGKKDPLALFDACVTCCVYITELFELEGMSGGHLAHICVCVYLIHIGTACKYKNAYISFKICSAFHSWKCSSCLSIVLIFKGDFIFSLFRVNFNDSDTWSEEW